MEMAVDDGMLWIIVISLTVSIAAYLRAFWLNVLIMRIEPEFRSLVDQALELITKGWRGPR